MFSTAMNGSSFDHAENKRFALLIATLSSFLTPFMASSIVVALPSIGNELEMDSVLLSWIVTSYLLAAVISLVPLGRIADIYGRKKIFLFGIIIYALSCALLAIAPSSAFFIPFRIFQGMGAAMIFATGTAILTSVFPAGERGRAIGISLAAVYLGLSLGPPLGGFLTHHLGWRSIFLSCLPLSLTTLAFVLWKLEGEWAEAKGERFDLTGSIIQSAALIAIVYGFSLLPRIEGAGLILVGILGGIGFVKWEMKAKSPILNMNLLKNNTVFAFSNIAALINYSSIFAVGFLLSLYLQYIKGFNPQETGLVLVSQPFVQAIFSPFIGKLSDRIEPRIVASVGMAFTVVGLSLLIFLNEKTGLVFLTTSFIFLGFGFALFSSPNTNAIMSSVEKRFYGVASATLGTMRLTGQLLSMGITTMILSTYMGRVQITPTHYPLFLKSVKVAFIIFAVLCFSGIFASLARGRVR